VIGKGSRKKAAQNISTIAQAQSAQLIRQQLRAENASELSKFGIMSTMKYWEVIAEKLSGAGWWWSYCSAVKQQGWR
jgi:DNA-binding transcriptional regulator YdaS (Cro superfamily)